MMLPQLKTVNSLAPRILVKMFQQALILEFEGRIFDKLEKCPKCGSEEIVRLDKVEKIACKIITENGFRDIKAEIKRYKCKSCKHVSNAESPFYPNCMYAKSVVDFCLFLVSKNPCNRTENILMNFGIQVDRDTVKNYAKRFKDRVLKQAGLKMFDKDIGLNLLKIFFHVKNVSELKEKYPELKRIESVSDETHASKKGAKKALKEENRKRKLKGGDEKKYPDSFTLAASYLPAINSYAALIATENAFNSMFSKLLESVMEGSDYNLTDGNPSYNDLPNHERCLFHKSKNLAKKDAVLKRLQQSALPEEVKKYLSKRYRELEEEAMKILKGKYPQFMAEGTFIGALTTNAMEGGNWRVKYELRTPYANINSIAARAILIALMDSMYNFRHGKPNESFAHINSQFAFEDAMKISTDKERKIVDINPNNPDSPFYKYLH